MIITSLIVEKIEKDHPRYPDQCAVPFTEVYRCETTDADGNQFEAAFFVTPTTGEMTPAAASNMLKVFALAVSRLDRAVEAA